ncbi:TonB-dependent receptor [uncultured Erythrobacter sp.]|uniref:TonB-dependent receptor n=1 Tax=uncultured Erythrobacter sp. TaxID=263913 RepID=UPI0026594205|nr:TonB-dependent receptor [uncultured Erythrobacter sp.]
MRKFVCASASLIAIATWSASAVAQDKPAAEELGEEEQSEIVVVGSFQAALENAFNDKRNADQVVDVVSAEDLGRLPDVSIAEAIARLPGVVANRDRGNATELSVRGLGPNLTATFLNGRELATGENSRNIRYETYPAELLRGAYVFKSPKANNVEGGIGGAIDLRTLRPLDIGKQRIVMNLRGSYFDLGDDIRGTKSTGYIGSISYVDQFFDNTLGIVLSYARREQPTVSTSTSIFPSGPRSPFGNANTAAFDVAGIERLPFGFDVGVRGGNDTRDGVVAAVQWQPSGAFQINADFFYSSLDFVNPSQGIRIEGANSEFGNLYTNIQGIDGSLTAGTITQTANFGLSISNVNERYTLSDDAYAGGLNAAWSTGAFTLEGDFGYSRNTRNAEFVSVETELHGYSGNTPFQLTNGPSVTFSTLPNGRSVFSFNNDLSDPQTNLISQLRVPDSDTVVDEIFSYSLTGKLELGGFLKSLELGARYSDRQKSLVARSAFGFINEADRRSVPVSLLQTPLTGAGGVTFPRSLAFDLDGVIDQVFGGYTPVQANFNRPESWVVEEEILSGFALANFEGSLAGMRLTGNVGVRVARTETVSSSTRLQNGEETSFIEVLTPFSIENEYTDVLPSLNIALFPGEKHIIRFGASKGISRAPLDDLNAGVSEFNFGTREAFGGNPLLEPFRANQLDLTYEWYRNPTSVLTVSAFYKDVETFIVRSVRTGVTLPSGLTGNFIQPINGEGGDIKGVEIAVSQGLTFLPEPLNGLGVYLNYSRIDSNIEVGPAFVEGVFPLPGLAENTFNAQIWFYKSGFEARLGYRYNDAFATELGDVPGQVLFSDAAEVVDFQMSYEFPASSRLKGVKLLLQANNLTNAPFETFYGTEGVRGRYEEFGRRYWFGASYEF